MLHIHKRAITLISLSLSLAGPVASALAAAPESVKAEHGMVVTAQHLASDVGIEVLKKGGNAVDAAVAVGYALAVVYPTAGNLGGGGFMTIRMKDGRTSFLDFRERAPLAATRAMYLDEQGKVKPRASLDGYLAVGTPGSVAGLEFAREKFGTRERADLIAPAVALAKNGFTLEQGDAEELNEGRERLVHDKAAAAIYVKPDGKAFVAGDTLAQPDLAATLSAIAEKGPDGFYKGAAAEAIVQASRTRGGILSQEDFDRYHVREMAPVTCTYRGYEIISAPPPSSGGVILCEILNILEAYPLSYLGYGSAQSVHLMVEAMRYAYADRNTALGDPDFISNPVSRLTDKTYATSIRAKIDLNRAGVSSNVHPNGAAESHETTHYSIIDKHGNAVSVTYTLNGSFGAGVVAPGTGVLLNNEMDDFTSKPGTPNLYGLVQGEANAIQPGKTPLSSMTPTIIARDGKPFMVIGSPGGARIITITLEAVLNVIDFGMNISEAIDAPRIHHQWLPDRIYTEPRALSPDTLKLLALMGYEVQAGGAWPVWGQAAGILVGGDSLAEIAKGTGARFNGAMDSRARSGKAEGY